MLNNFENKRGIIKILIYESVIEINQINDCDLFCNNHNLRLGAICVGCFTYEFDQIGICSLFTGKCN